MDQKIKEIQKERLLISSQNPARAKVLSTLLSDAKALAKAAGRAEATFQDLISSAEMNVASLQKAIKKSNGGGKDAEVLVVEYQAQIAIAQEFLPKIEKVSAEAIRAEVIKRIGELAWGKKNKTSFGPLMGALKKHFGDSADPSEINKILGIELTQAAETEKTLAEKPTEEK
jgi:uncharacterized protein YqeY